MGKSLARYLLWIDPEIFTDRACSVFLDLSVTGNRRFLSRLRIDPDRMSTAFALNDRALLGQESLKRASFHAAKKPAQLRFDRLG
jgi:hypothetical protein